MPRRKPTRPKHRADLIKRLQAAGWQGDTESVDFDMFYVCRYDLEHTAQAGAERSRLRHDLMALADRLGLGAVRPTVTPHRTPNRSPEHLKKVGRLLAELGALGPEAQDMVRMGQQVDAIELNEDGD